MRPVSIRGMGVAAGVASALAGGALAGGWWWMVAGAGAGAALGGAWDRHLDHVQVIAALALVAGLMAAGHDWYVVLLAVGPVASIELLAAADRASIVRPVVTDLGRVGWIAAATAATSGTVLVLGQVSAAAPAWAGVGAGVAGIVAVRVIAR